jgi:hypothetical protein
MSYTINLTGSTGNITQITIPDGTINTQTSLVLVGKNWAGYGQFLDQNFINLLQSSTGTTPPGAPLTGQLWWDAGNGVLKAYNGSVFKVISGATSSTAAPSGSISVAGDLWYDSTNAQLNVYTGASWLLVGPQSTSGQGTSGAVVATISDTLAVFHVVVELYVNNSIVGIISKDATFTPGSPVTGGWGTQPISPGITLATVVGGNIPLFTGTATSAQTLLGYNANAFMLTGNNTSTTGTLSVLNNTGLYVGTNSDFRATVSGTAVSLLNQTTNGNLTIGVNVGGTPTAAIAINGTTGLVTIPSLVFGNSSSFTNITVNNILNGAGNGVGNIGNATATFNTIFARSTSAQYADVAERFAADVEMLPGTVVELGGSAEITQSITELSDNVFGVISTQAAYLMNSGAGSDATHPPIAMTGRVPVRVVGIVHKGDRLVSAGRGLARSAQAGEATWSNTIGRALVDKLDTAEGTVEAIVTIK